MPKFEITAEFEVEYRRQSAVVGEADRNNKEEMAFLDALTDEILRDLDEEERLADRRSNSVRARSEEP